MFGHAFFKTITSILMFLCMPLMHSAQKKSPFQKFQLTEEYKKALSSYHAACREQKDSGLCQESEQDFINFTIVNAFIDKVSNGLHDEVIKSLQDKKLLSLLDTFSTQEAFNAAEELKDDGLMLKILSNNQLVTLLSGPNGPLIMALQKTSGKDEAMVTSTNQYLKYAQALYHQLIPKHCFEALTQASDCKYSNFMVAPLLTRPFYGYDSSGQFVMLNKGLLYKITPEQVGNLLFIAFSKDDKNTIAALLNDEKVFGYINNSNFNTFICKTLALPSNKAFEKPTRYLILYRLLKNEQFLMKLQIGLQAFDHVEEDFRTMFLACAQDQSEAVIKLVLANAELSKYLSFDVLGQAQRQARGKIQEHINQFLSKQKKRPSLSGSSITSSSKSSSSEEEESFRLKRSRCSCSFFD